MDELKSLNLTLGFYFFKNLKKPKFGVFRFFRFFFKKLKKTQVFLKPCQTALRTRRSRKLNSTQHEFTDAGETPHCPHLFIKIKYKTIRHILLVLIYLQFRLGRLWNQTLHLYFGRRKKTGAGDSLFARLNNSSKIFIRVGIVVVCYNHEIIYSIVYGYNNTLLLCLL